MKTFNVLFFVLLTLILFSCNEDIIMVAKYTDIGIAEKNGYWYVVLGKKFGS